MNINFLYILGCILFTVLGQLLIKKGTLQIRDAVSGIFIINIYIILGLISAIIAAISWIIALKHFKLSYAYPFLSLSFMFVAIFSMILFDEYIKTTQWIGLGIVVIGLIIGSQ